MLKTKVQFSEAGQTLEKYVRKVLSNVPLSLIYKLFRKKDIKVNGHWEDTKFVVKSGDEVTIYIKDEELESYKKGDTYKPNDFLKQHIVYEDNNVLIVNKPRGMLVQKNQSKYQASLDTLVVEYLIFKGEYDPLNELAFKPSPAHRIDRNTSGIVIFGKNNETLQYLFTLLKERQLIEKHYIALVKGVITEDGVVEAPLKKDMETGKVIVDSIKDGAKKAKTLYHVLKNYSNYTLLDLTLITGRTHQIRVHMQYIGHPLVGDTKYGDFDTNKVFEQLYDFKNQFLHANDVTFQMVDAPLTNLRNQTFEADLPDELIKLLKKID